MIPVTVCGSIPGPGGFAFHSARLTTNGFDMRGADCAAGWSSASEAPDDANAAQRTRTAAYRLVVISRSRCPRELKEGCPSCSREETPTLIYAELVSQFELSEHGRSSPAT